MKITNTVLVRAIAENSLNVVSEILSSYQPDLTPFPYLIVVSTLAVSYIVAFLMLRHCSIARIFMKFTLRFSSNNIQLLAKSRRTIIINKKVKTTVQFTRRINNHHGCPKHFRIIYESNGHL